MQLDPVLSFTCDKPNTNAQNRCFLVLWKPLLVHLFLLFGSCSMSFQSFVLHHLLFATNCNTKKLPQNLYSYSITISFEIQCGLHRPWKVLKKRKKKWKIMGYHWRVLEYSWNAPWIKITMISFIKNSTWCKGKIWKHGNMQIFSVIIKDFFLFSVFPAQFIFHYLKYPRNLVFLGDGIAITSFHLRMWKVLTLYVERKYAYFTIVCHSVSNYRKAKSLKKWFWSLKSLIFFPKKFCG